MNLNIGDNVTWQNPWVFWIVGPVVVWLCIREFLRWRKLRADSTDNFAEVPLGSLMEIAEVAPSLRARIRGPLLCVLGCIWVLALTLAAARPQHVNVIDRSEARRNLILSLDISGSMNTRDFIRTKGGERVMGSRITGVKEVVADFLSARRDDRVGLVVFGASAFVQAPLTRDHRVVRELVERLQVGMAGDGTAIGDGLGLAIKRIADLPAESRAIVLLTDGVSNSGQVTPKAAAEVAATMGVRVYAVGIGRPDDGGMDATGAAGFDEEALKFMAEKTGGLYRNAQSVEGLRAVYQAISELEMQESTEPEARVVEELFAHFAAVALLAYLLALTLGSTILRRIPQ